MTAVARPVTTIPNAAITRLGRRDVLVSMPNGRQYGHQALEMALAFAEARQKGLPVHFVRPSIVANPTLFEFEPSGVEVLKSSFLTRTWLDARMRCSSDGQLRRRLRRRAAVFAKQFKKDFHGEVWRRLADPTLPPGVRERMKRLDLVVRLKLSGRSSENPDDAEEDDKPYYYHRRLLREAVSVTLRPSALDSARREAVAIGVADDAPIVTLHMREAGYKLGRELQDSKPGKGRDDSVRNVRAESYFETIDFLVNRGYVVVRVGDPTMVPVRRRGVIDLATSPHRSSLLETYCIWRSHFLLGCDSGPSYVCYFTNTPLVCVNCTAPIAAYPIRRLGLYTLKTMTERSSGRTLRLADMAWAEDPVYFRDSRKYQYRDNTSEEILETVREMLDLLDTGQELAPAQLEYKEWLLAADRALRPMMDYVSKWGSDEGFIGDGRIGRYFAERHV